MAEKIIKTKIKLRQEEYSYWLAPENTVTPPAEKVSGAGEKCYYVPYYGEVCFCEITAAN
jgi:hypothetical protein